MSKEIREIIEKLNILAPGEKAVLATVVDVQGSSYRLPGAKMLILKNGACVGTVSGGCLETDVLEKAKRVLKTDAPEVLTYDTAKHEDSVFSLNMGCRGVIRILLEPITPDHVLTGTFQFINEHRFSHTVGTLISFESNYNVRLGGRIFYSKFDQFDFQNLPNYLESLSELKNDCENFFYQNGEKPTYKYYQLEQGKFEFFFENIKPPVSLLIFGAGADAIPLAETGKNLGWQVTVIDHRPAYASKERFSSADEILHVRPENLAEQLTIDENTVAVVMTHNFESDKLIQKYLFGTNAQYIGALGPKKRTEKLLAEIGESWRENLFAPVGLDIGADTPELIALSIAAEIQSVLKNRAGGFLRHRKGSIYGRDE